MATKQAIKGELQATVEDSHLVLSWRGERWVERFALGLVQDGHWLWSHVGMFHLKAVCQRAGEDALGSYTALEGHYTDPEGPALVLRLKLYEPHVVIEAEALRDWKGTALADSFVETTFNVPILHLHDRRFMLFTWGLRDAQEPYPGGSWPEVRFGNCLADLPQEEAFAPLVLYDKTESCLIISPLSHFLISPLRVIRTPDGPAVARGLHGSIAAVPKGTVLKTILVFGQGLIKTLYAWGDLLLKLGGKRRLDPWAHPLLSKLSYWNCYGSYYTELLHPLNEQIMLELARDFQGRRIPVGYWGLDLWYEYERIGLAKRYRPDPKKYPRGLKALAQETGLPFVLHLSALSREGFSGKQDQAYGEIVWGKRSACPVGETFYRELAKQLKAEGAIGVWHDWLWSQQHLVPPLRSQLELPDQWFAHLCQGLAEEGLPLLLCMPTMGFHLASTCHSNVIAARSYADYLFKLPGPVTELRARGERISLVSRQAYLKNELWMGLLLHVLGMLPFHDVFISNPHHPEGFAEPWATQEAWWRALSTGPVGFGDKIGQADPDVLKRLVLPDGLLAKPDHPLWPLIHMCGKDIWIAYTKSHPVEGPPWIYVAVLNVGNRSQVYNFESRQLPLAQGSHCIYDPVSERIIPNIQGQLEQGEAHMYVLVPLLSGIAPIGFRTFVPAPSSHVRRLWAGDKGIQLDLRLQPGLCYELQAWGEQQPLVMEVHPPMGALIASLPPGPTNIQRWEVLPQGKSVHFVLRQASG